ncbi:MAG: hypothetical protein QE284_11970 [Rhizobium sp.]|nr:hypothetical protein [Rhizobium sp.]
MSKSDLTDVDFVEKIRVRLANNSFALRRWAARLGFRYRRDRYFRKRHPIIWLLDDIEFTKAYAPSQLQKLYAETHSNVIADFNQMVEKGYINPDEDIYGKL